MLIEFSVSNYRSIKDTQTLSLVRGKGRELIDTNSFDPLAPATTPLLCSAVVYGPNAAGKSNLLKAMRLIERLVLFSATWQRGDDIPVEPYLLDDTTKQAPTQCEVTFIAEGVRYQYGFSATRERIHDEWLFAYPHGRAQKWLGRLWDVELEEYQWDPCSALTGEKRVWQNATRQNALFLSVAVQLNSTQLQPVYDWFKKNLRIPDLSQLSSRLTAECCLPEDAYKNEVVGFLKVADLDIRDIKVQAEKISAEDITAQFSENIRRALLEEMSDRELTRLDIEMAHQSSGGGLVFFGMDDESDGTQQLFKLAGPWLEVLKKGYVLVIDELHTHLHPKIVQFLVQLFHDPQQNSKHAQLIFTTHETVLLDKNVFRRDQIWFCEKRNAAQGSCIYPLADFAPRKDRENLGVNYLDGRYGALPYIGILKPCDHEDVGHGE